MKSTMITSAIQPLESVILSKRVTRNMEGQLELELTNKESGTVSREIVALPKENAILYTEKGTLEISQTRSSKSWLI